MRAFPEGLLVFGDAICSFNPIYAQGMTMTALQAVALRDCLARGDTDLSRRFFRAAARRIRPVWSSNQNSDLYMSADDGRRSLTQRAAMWQMRKALTVAERDTTLAEGIFRVGQFIDPRAALLRFVAKSSMQRLAASLR